MPPEVETIRGRQPQVSPSIAPASSLKCGGSIGFLAIAEPLWGHNAAAWPYYCRCQHQLHPFLLQLPVTLHEFKPNWELQQSVCLPMHSRCTILHILIPALPAGNVL